jgi:hypothetical protein
MISAYLMGGLGNQMFQIAAATSLAIENDDEAIFNFEACFTPLEGLPSTKYKDNLFKKINNSQNIITEFRHEESSHAYQKIVYKKNLLIYGYFQSEKYFMQNKEKILDIFYINDADVSFLQDAYKNIDLNNTVSVHIRRGDYLKFPDTHPVCEAEYYKKAMSYFPNKNFLFISQDIEWVKQNFKGNNIFYSKNNNEISDFIIQTLCCDNIIANSTFSWWAAYLNKNKNKKVIAPSQWFGKDSSLNHNDIVPCNWTKI